MGGVVLQTEPGFGDTGATIAPEDLLRANTYGLLALLLRAPTTAQHLDELALQAHDDGEMGSALGALAEAAADNSVDAVDDEFHDLFVGVGDSELKPYGSYYLTGFMYEKPLANLRQAMAELGIEKSDSTSNPEDHIAALCEIMCGLITGAFGAVVALDCQRAFFDQHIAPWGERFFEDLEAASGARFFRPVGTVGRLFMRIESQAFQMAA